MVASGGPRKTKPCAVPQSLKDLLGLGGRPQKWNPDEWIPVILAWCSSGRMLADLCEHKDMEPPPWGKVYEWRKTVDGFKDALETAREVGRDRIAEDTLRIADGVDFNPFVDAKLRVDTRIRMLGRWSHRFAEKRQVEQTGNTSVQIVTGVPDPDSETKSELLQ